MLLFCYLCTLPDTKKYCCYTVLPDTKDTGCYAVTLLNELIARYQDAGCYTVTLYMLMCTERYQLLH